MSADHSEDGVLRVFTPQEVISAQDSEDYEIVLALVDEVTGLLCPLGPTATGYAFAGSRTTVRGLSVSYSSYRCSYVPIDSDSYNEGDVMVGPISVFTAAPDVYSRFSVAESGPLPSVYPDYAFLGGLKPLGPEVVGLYHQFCNELFYSADDAGHGDRSEESGNDEGPAGLQPLSTGKKPGAAAGKLLGAFPKGTPTGKKRAKAQVKGSQATVEVEASPIFTPLEAVVDRLSLRLDDLDARLSQGLTGGLPPRATYTRGAPLTAGKSSLGGPARDFRGPPGTWTPGASSSFEPPPRHPSDDGYGAAASSSAGAAVRARERVAEALRSHGLDRPPVGQTFSASRERKTPGFSLPADLVERASAGGEDATHALRLLELDVLTRLADQGRSQSQSRNDDMLSFDEVLGTDADGGALRGLQGSGNMERVLGSVRRNPERWCQAFDDSICRACYSDVTGLPWSLFSYMKERVQFEQWQGDLQRCAHLVASLHAIHRRGPQSHWELGAAIDTAFKSIEQAARDGSDWTLAWTWVDLPDPRPRSRYTRGLAHPAQYAAGLSYLKEVNTLQSHREALIQPRRPRKDPGGKGDHKGGATGDQQQTDNNAGDGADDAAPGQPKGRRRRGNK